jgi:hypothetical protein
MQSDRQGSPRSGHSLHAKRSAPRRQVEPAGPRAPSRESSRHARHELHASLLPIRGPAHVSWALQDRQPRVLREPRIAVMEKA